MTSNGGFEVDLDALREHASRLQAVVDPVALAADAARQVDLYDGAFGLMCAFLPPIFNGAETSAVDAVAATGRALERSAEGVTDMALAYAAADEAAQARLERRWQAGANRHSRALAVDSAPPAAGLP